MVIIFGVPVFRLNGITVFRTIEKVKVAKNLSPQSFPIF